MRFVMTPGYARIRVPTSASPVLYIVKMRAIRTGLVLVAATGLVLAGCGDDDDEPTTTNTTPASEEIVNFDVKLEGSAEPQPGDLNGSGSAQLRVDPNGTEICYQLSVDGIEGVTAAHIHEGRNGTAGPIAVTLVAPITGPVDECVETSSSIIAGLSSGNRSFYVNVHSTNFPDGAVRAQLTG
jgi:hypothetical protein